MQLTETLGLELDDSGSDSLGDGEVGRVDATESTAMSWNRL